MNLYELEEQYVTVLEMAMNSEEDFDYEAMLQGLEGAISDKIDSWCKVIKTLEANETALGAEISRLSARKQSISKNAKQMKEAMKAVMIRLDMKKHKSPMFSVSVTNGREKLEVTDISQIPDQFKTIPDPVADKRSILEAIKAGQEIAGTRLVRGEEGLMIR